MRILSVIIFLFFGASFFTNIIAQPGSLDAAFGIAGRVTTSFGTSSFDVAEDLSIQSDGKIIAIGSAINPATGLNEIALARYNSNGTLDNSFGTNGRVTTTVVAGFDNSAFAVKMQSDGKIVIAAAANDTSVNTPQNGYFIALRYNSGGTLDNTFGTGGIAAIQMTAAVSPDVLVTDMLIQPDGKIIISGAADLTGNNDLIFIRLGSSGLLDNTFGTSGISIHTPGGGGAWPQAIAIQPDGKIVFAGAFDLGTVNAPLIGRINSNGTIDNSFGTSGFVFPSYGSSSAFMGIAVQSDGKLVVCGFDTNGSLIARFISTGSTDNSFGSGGSVITPIGSQQDARFNDVAIQSNGKIVAAGTADTSFALIRTTSAGLLDTGFGLSGIIETQFSGSYFADGKSIKLQSDGKIVVAGYVVSTNFATPGMFGLARYEGDVLTAIHEEPILKTAVLFPNPNNGSFMLQVNEKYKCNVIDSFGQILYSAELAAGNNQVVLPDELHGIFTLELISNSEKMIKKIVIN